jgi:hypothetical protein
VVLGDGKELRCSGFVTKAIRHHRREPAHSARPSRRKRRQRRSGELGGGEGHAAWRTGNTMTSSRRELFRIKHRAHAKKDASSMTCY